ncbi:hypothetical protein CALVIDRAFT_595807 [Calocera viscosa TUFC12733]|uniref:Uncharacterized protein n=1 Tax=Calocera viscosa (strain TUFC12733) TaxID=1330018 RepID=A0A167QFC9_CALVF|nr:hypothetical protein CALVIDRAFT_595807 [Calocera viscosa TUFC12733]
MALPRSPRPSPSPIIIPPHQPTYPTFPSRPASAALSTTTSALPTPSTSAPGPNALGLDLTPPGLTPPTPNPVLALGLGMPTEPRVHFRPRVHISGAGGRYRFLPTSSTPPNPPANGHGQGYYTPNPTSGATSVSSSFSVPLRPEPREGEGKAAGGWFRRGLPGKRERGERAPLLAGSSIGIVDSPSPSPTSPTNPSSRPPRRLARRVVPLAGDRPPPTGQNGIYEPPSARAREWEEETWEGREEFAECPGCCAVWTAWALWGGAVVEAGLSGCARGWGCGKEPELEPEGEGEGEGYESP